MKTLMFSLTFVVALILYGAGFFVPETQGIENIVDGHVVLNDVEMAQLVGGSRLTQQADITYRASGTVPACIGYAVEDCESVRSQNVFYQKYICVSCNDQYEAYQYSSRNGEPRHILFRCKNMYDYCGIRRDVKATFSSCVNKLSNQCKF